MRTLLTRAATVAALAVAVAFPARAAHAAEQVVIRDGRTPIGYSFELEPHLVLGTAPPGPGYGTGAGLGVRASWVLSQDGFIRGVNDSLAIGVGLDYGRYDAAFGFQGYRDQCLSSQPGPAGTSVCTQVTSNGGAYNYLFVPVVLQWNFWITRNFSAFGEPGVDLYLRQGFGVAPALFVGGRYQLADKITFTLRLGYPTLALGVSFLL